MDTTIESKALTLLEKWELDNLPIDVSKLAECLELPIVEEDLEDNIAGFLFSKNNRSYVGINSNHHENRKRFTIAHEIGHYVLLHHKLTDDIHVDTKSSVFRRTGNTTDNEQKEKDANKFSAALLMPHTLLVRYIKEQNINLNDDLDISKLSRKLVVSEKTLTYRLLNLGIINYK